MAKVTQVSKNKKSPIKRSEKIERAAKAAARTAVLAIKRTEEEEIEDEQEEFSPDEPSESVLSLLGDNQEEATENRAGFDLFIDIGEKLASSGEAPKYTIYKNHDLLVSVDHPYSWDMLQKEYGGGFYKVLCRSSATGRYKGQDTKRLATPPGWKSPVELSTHTEGEASVSKNEEFMRFMTFVKESGKEEREEAKKSEGSMASVLAALITNMKPVDTSVQMMTFIMENNKSTLAVLDKINESNLRMFEKLNDKIEKMHDSKDKGMSAAETIKMYQDADDRALDRAEKQRQLAKEIADEREEYRSGGEGKSESTVDTILKNLLPVLAAGASAQMTKPAQPVQAAPLRRAPSPFEARTLQAARAVNAPVTPVAVANGPVQAARPVGPRPVATPANPKPQVPSPVAKEPKMSKKDTIMQVAMPIIADCLQKNTPATDCSKAVLTTLAQVGVSQDDVRANFTWKDIEAIVKQYGVPEAYFQYLKDFFDAMVSKTIPANDAHPGANA